MALPAYVRKGRHSAAIGDFGRQYVNGFEQGTVATVTAFAGGGKPSATPLVAQYTRISVCATSADSVLLPAAVAGRVIQIDNAGAAPARLFGQGTDTIDGAATGTGVPLANAKRSQFVCYVAGAWISAQLGVVAA